MMVGSGLTHCSQQERAGWETVYLRRVRFCREGRDGEPPSFWTWLGGGPTATSQRKAQLASTWHSWPQPLAGSADLSPSFSVPAGKPCEAPVTFALGF